MTGDIIEATEATVRCVPGGGIGMVQDQPAPKPNTLPAMWDLVIEEMRHRDRIGRQRYGTPLQPFNGRDALRDLSEELLDAIVYTKQFREEMQCLGSKLLSLHALLVESMSQDKAAPAETVSLLEQIFEKNPALCVALNSSQNLASK